MKTKHMTREEILNKLNKVMNAVDMCVIRLMSTQQLREYSKKFI